MTREIDLPPTRKSVTHKFSIGNTECYLIVGLTPDGRPAELFCKIAKSGSTMAGLMACFCRALSLALQYGLPLVDAVQKFEGMRFEPMGTTSNPEIPDADSLVDYIVKYLDRHWGSEKDALQPRQIHTQAK